MKLELSEKEYLGIIKAFTKITKTLVKLEGIRLENEHQMALIRLKKEQGQKRHTFIVDDGDESEEDSEEDLFDYAPPPEEDTPPIQFTVHKNKAETDAVGPDDPDLLDAQEKGKTVLANLITMWLQNFQVEEAEQPPRGEDLKTLSLGKDGQRLLHYVISVGGTTHAVQEVWPGEEDLYLIRYVAENITQVSSILFPELGQLLEHPNPLEE